VPPEWQQDLDRLWPGEQVSRLVLHWLAGLEGEPVQRWAIWEVLPTAEVGKVLEQERAFGVRNSLTEALWKALAGPDPRTLGHLDAKTKRWRTSSLVSREQWDLHREVGGLPMLSWIIEGPKGGHSWQCGMFEQGFLMAAGVEADTVQALAQAWPNPGSQPFAPYDQRVFRALQERDQLRQWRESLKWTERMNRTAAGLIVEGEHTKRHQFMLDRVFRWLDNQIGDAVSDIPRTLLPQWSDFQTVEE